MSLRQWLAYSADCRWEYFMIRRMNTKALWHKVMVTSNTNHRDEEKKVEYLNLSHDDAPR